MITKERLQLMAVLQSMMRDIEQQMGLGKEPDDSELDLLVHAAQRLKGDADAKKEE